MSGATGAGPAGTSRGTEADDGGRGSAARAADPHTTNLKAIKSPAKDTPSPDAQESQGGTVRDTRGPQTQKKKPGAGPSASAAQPQPAAQEPGTASPLPGERQAQPQAGPYHPPQAYPAQQAAAGRPGAPRPPPCGVLVRGRAPLRASARRGCGWRRPTRGR